MNVAKIIIYRRNTCNCSVFASVQISRKSLIKFSVKLIPALPALFDHLPDSDFYLLYVPLLLLPLCLSLALVGQPTMARLRHRAIAAAAAAIYVVIVLPAAVVSFAFHV